ARARIAPQDVGAAVAVEVALPHGRADGDDAGHADATGGAVSFAEEADGAGGGKRYGGRPRRTAEVAVAAGTVTAVGAAESGDRTGIGRHVVDAAAVVERDRVAGRDRDRARRERHVGVRVDDVVGG